MTPKQKFLVLLAMTAKQTSEQLDEIRAEFYRERLEPLGYDRANEALSRLLESARRFPTVAEIKAAMGVTDASDDDKAREVGERIWGAIGKYGYQVSVSGQIRVNDYLGPIGVEVARMQGGWNTICEIATMDNGATLKAQWRELAAVIIRKQRGGRLEAPPEFAPLPEKAAALVRQLDANWGDKARG